MSANALAGWEPKAHSLGFLSRFFLTLRTARMRGPRMMTYSRLVLTSLLAATALPTVLAAQTVAQSSVVTSAQQWSGFLTGGFEATYRSRGDESYRDLGPALVRGGALVRIGKSRFWGGAQGDVLFLPPYTGARGGPIGQVDIWRAGRNHLLAYAGYVFGANAFGNNYQPILGAGLNVWIRQRRGLRIAAEDAFHRSPRFCLGPMGRQDCIPASTDHTLSGVIGIVWR